MNLTLTVATAARTASLCVAGDLDYETTDDLVGTVGRLLTDEPALAHLHLDLSKLSFCDSAGLSGLLLVHRRTCQAGARLHLDHRPQFLDRILDITGVFDHLVNSAHLEDQDSPNETKVR
jgi:anti-anti-sigma factor